MSTATEIAALSVLVPAQISYIAMSSILSAILRSVSGGTAPTVAKVEEADVSIDSTSTDDTAETPDIIVFKGLPYVYQGRQQGSPTKTTTKLSPWRHEQLRRANPARVMEAAAKPLITLYGPNSLPYARNPSGVDAQLDVATRAPVPKEPATIFRERMNEHFQPAKGERPAESRLIHDAVTTIPAQASDSTRSAMPLAQVIVPKADPFLPLFEQAVKTQAHASDEQAIIQDTAKYAAKGKADADVDWRKRSEGPQTVMSMDALFEKFSPAAAPVVNSPKPSRVLTERKTVNAREAVADESKSGKKADTPINKATKRLGTAKRTPMSKASKGTASQPSRSRSIRA